MNISHKIVWSILVCLFVVSVVSCKPKATPTVVEVQKALQPTEMKKNDIDIGDVEVGIRVEAVLAGESFSETVKEQQFRSKRGWIDFNSITVSGAPAPKELYIKFPLLGAKFPEDVIASRVELLRDDEVIGSYAVVLVGTESFPFHECTLDVFSGLPALPKTMLIHVRGEFILLPRGTDPSTVDPKTVTASPDKIGTVACNPIRINIGEVDDL